MTTNRALSATDQEPTPANGPTAAARSALSPWRFRLGVVVTILLALCSTAAWLLSRPEGPTPAERLAQALLLLDQHQDNQARELAKELESLGYRDPNFAGGVEFILGMAAFRSAELLDDVGKRQQWNLAATYLREAERRDLEAGRRPEWCFALGSSLYQLGAFAEARPLLEEAHQTNPSRSLATTIMLTDIYLDPSQKTFELLSRALELNTQVRQAAQLSPAQRHTARLQRAEVLLALSRPADAEAVLHETAAGNGAPNDLAKTDADAVVVLALVRMAEGRDQEALEMLSAVSTDIRLGQTSAQQASFLMGVAAEHLARDQEGREVAVAFYDRTVDRFERTQEALAASLRMADLLQQDGNNEQALQAYGTALRMVRKPQEFRNRWLSLGQFRQTILNAWNRWLDQQAFAEAVALAELMTPLLPQEQAYEMAARAHLRWAEATEAQLAEAPQSVRQSRQAELQQRWRQCGTASERVAQTRRTAVNYPEAVWASAEYFRRGRDLDQALRQYEKFLDTQPVQLLPLALLRRGQVLLDLDRCDEARQDFRRVVTDHPTDPAMFEAQLLLGQCALERNQPDQAEQLWRAMLASDNLTPAALEWRRALFLLGRLLHGTALMRKRQADALEPLTAGATNPEADALRSEAFARWTDAIERLDEYLKRYPDSPDAFEARYLFAKALQQKAEQPRRRLQTAETENARREARTELQAVLARSAGQFHQLRDQLVAAAQADRLDPLGQELLRTVCFETAHTDYALQHFDQAIAGYTSAANRYPQDAQVLLAYVQMANCYDHMGKPDESRSMLEQAKVILKQQIPETAFHAPSTSLNRQEWEQWLDWATRWQQ